MKTEIHKRYDPKLMNWIQLVNSIKDFADKQEGLVQDQVTHEDIFIEIKAEIALRAGPMEATLSSLIDFKDYLEHESTPVDFVKISLAAFSSISEINVEDHLYDVFFLVFVAGERIEMWLWNIKPIIGMEFICELETRFGLTHFSDNVGSMNKIDAQQIDNKSKNHDGTTTKEDESTFEDHGETQAIDDAKVNNKQARYSPSGTSITIIVTIIGIIITGFWYMYNVNKDKDKFELKVEDQPLWDLVEMRDMGYEMKVGEGTQTTANINLILYWPVIIKNNTDNILSFKDWNVQGSTNVLFVDESGFEIDPVEIRVDPHAIYECNLLIEYPLNCIGFAMLLQRFPDQATDLRTILRNTIGDPTKLFVYRTGYSAYTHKIIVTMISDKGTKLSTQITTFAQFDNFR